MKSIFKVGAVAAFAMSMGAFAQAGGLTESRAPQGIAWIVPEVLAADSELYLGLHYGQLGLDGASSVTGFVGPNPYSVPFSFGFPNSDVRLSIGTLREAHGVFLGGEIGVSFRTMEATASSDLMYGGGIGIGPPTVVTFQNRVELGPQVDARLIVGARYGDIAFFGTAGVAGRTISSHLSSNAVGHFATSEDILVAPTFSVGVERRLTDVAALRLEVQRTDYQPFDFSTGTSSIPQLNGSSQVDIEETRIQVGFTLRY